ncbi:MAG: NADH-quinone oxidoreductase subunit N [Acidimicrobiia bacterium]|nr:MAG: NADH-quinone oxidoreductase subunit N [Acidimicrobiia bacterium]
MNNAALLPIAPEVILLAGALIVILLLVLLDRPFQEAGIVSFGALAAAALVSVLQWQALDNGAENLYFSAQGVPVPRLPMVVMDHYSAFAGMVIFVVGILGLAAAWRLVLTLASRRAEFLTLVLLAVAGLHMMAASANMIMLFIGLETASIALYVLAGFTRERADADEAAVKYFLLGSLASVIFVYGAALLFAATGSTAFYGAGSIREFLAENIVAEPAILLLAMGLVIVGMLFKVTAAPFHQWAPDVYQGAPSGIVGLMAAGVKIAGFAALGRILFSALPSQIDDWAPVLAIVAGVSMLIGTLLAAVQDDVKRILAYSGVANAGYILMAFVAGGDGIGSMWFYVTTYALTVVGVFAVVAVVSGSRSGSSPLADWSGLSSRAPLLAWAMLIMLLALAGIPFTTGFVAKVGVFTAATDAGYLWLMILALVTTVVGLYVYFRVAAAMFMEDAAGEEAVVVPQTTSLVVAVVAVVVVLLGLLPWPLLDLAREALPL